MNRTGSQPHESTEGESIDHRRGSHPQHSPPLRTELQQNNVLRAVCYSASMRGHTCQASARDPAARRRGKGVIPSGFVTLIAAIAMSAVHAHADPADSTLTSGPVPAAWITPAEHTGYRTT